MKGLDQLASDLEQRAAIGDVISYNKLAREYGQPRVSPENFLMHPFCEAFGRLDREDIAQGKPLRTAMVFSEVLNRIGNGFFKMLELKRGQSISESRRTEEWTTELKHLRELYAGR